MPNSSTLVYIIEIKLHKEVLLMGLILFLRIIILLVFLAAGFLFGGWVSDISKKEITQVIEVSTCVDNICPEPKDWEEGKNK